MLPQVEVVLLLQLTVLAVAAVLVAVVALVSSLLLVFQLSATEEYPQIR